MRMFFRACDCRGLFVNTARWRVQYTRGFLQRTEIVKREVSQIISIHFKYRGMPHIDVILGYGCLISVASAAGFDLQDKIA